MSESTTPSTPLMRQYSAIKKQHPTALLFFRLGDFYELFFEDAIVAARELQITLTSRNKEKDISVPMCGVPYHAAEGYLAKLLRKGFKVAICEQMENPKLAKTTRSRGSRGGMVWVRIEGEFPESCSPGHKHFEWRADKRLSTIWENRAVSCRVAQAFAAETKSL